MSRELHIEPEEGKNQVLKICVLTGYSVIKTLMQNVYAHIDIKLRPLKNN